MTLRIYALFLHMHIGGILVYRASPSTQPQTNNMIMLLDLPDIIYTLFKSYLLNDDFIQLVSTSQRYFKEIRRENIYFRLDGSKSERFCVDESYRDYIHSRVSRLDRQISMSLSIDLVQKYKDLLAVNRLHVKNKKEHTDHMIPILPVKELYVFTLTQIQDINSLSTLDKLFIYKCDKITDINALKDVKDIKIYGNHNIRDFSCLGKQETLNLSGCSQLSDVNSFSGIQRIWISDCENLIDVSPLHGISFLALTYCTKVQDISSLGNHKQLTISHCAYALKGYEILATVKDISLDSCDITDVSMIKKAVSVELRNLSHLKDVSSLANMKELKIINCKEIEDISMLNKVRALQLCSLPALRKYDGLEQHPNLAIRCDEGKGNIDILTKLRCAVSKLYFNKTDFFVFVPLPSFSRLMLLSINDNDEEFELQGCEDIHTVQLYCCSKIKSTKGLGRNREVEILFCDELIDVNHLANVPIVTISCCSKVIDVSCLSNVPRLKVS